MRQCPLASCGIAFVLMNHMKPSPVNPQGPVTIGWQAPLIDACLALVRRKFTVLLCIIACLGIGGLKYLSTPNTYRSSAVAILLPREKPVFDVAVDSGNLETSEDAAKREDTGALMLPANPDLYTTLIRSRSVLQEVAAMYQDQLVLGVPGRTRSEELIGKLRSMIVVESTEQGMMTVTVTSSSPDLSAELANALVGVGEAASKDIEKQLVLQQAIYIDESLVLAKNKLKHLTDHLKEFTGSKSIIDPRNQANDFLRQRRELTLKLNDLERELAARRLSWTDADPEVQRLILEVHLCKDQISALQDAVAGNVGSAEYAPFMVDYEELSSKVRLQSDLVVSLSAKSDVLHIRAEQPAGSIAVVRPATASHRPVGPSRKVFLMMSLGLGMISGLGLALLQEQWAQAKQEPYVAERLAQLPKLNTPGVILRRFSTSQGLQS